MTSVAGTRVLPESAERQLVEAASRLDMTPSSPDHRRPPMVWAECEIEGEEVVVRVSGWRKVLATRASVRFSLASIVRIDHDPLARAHVKVGWRQWRRHGTGVWRVGVYHGLDGWSFWSIGVGRNAVLIECSGERFRFVVVEVADADATVREIRAAAARVTQRIPGGLESRPAPSQQRPSLRSRHGRERPFTGQD